MKAEGRKTSSQVRQKFVNWLKKNDIEYDFDRSSSSLYYTCTFDNGTDDPIELKIRFSDHPPGYYGYSVDIDTYTQRLSSFDDIISELKKFGLVIEKGKYMGSRYAERYDLTPGSPTYAQRVKYDIPVKRGNPDNMGKISGLAGIGYLFGRHK